MPQYIGMEQVIIWGIEFELLIPEQFRVMWGIKVFNITVRYTELASTKFQEPIPVL